MGQVIQASVRLRPANDSDKEFIYQLNRQAYEDVVTRQFGPWDEAFQRGLFETKWPDARYFVIELNGQSIGALWKTDVKDHLFLNEIQLLPAHQGKGIGTWLINQIVDQARDAKKPLRLRVLKMNQRAKSLYERLGFTTCGEIETHYLMEKA